MIQIPRQKKSKKVRIVDLSPIEQEDNFKAIIDPDNFKTEPPTIAESFDIIEKDHKDIIGIDVIGNGIPNEVEEIENDGTEWEDEDHVLEHEEEEEEDEEEIEHLTEDELENIVDDNNVEGLDDENEEIILPPITNQELPITPSITNNEESTVEELEKEREYARHLKVLEFLREYAKDINRNVDEVAHKVTISVDTARKNLNEYIDVVKDTISKKTYPDGLLMYYNADVEEKDKEKRIKYHHLNSLKDLVKRYSKFDINKTLNSNGSDTFISNKSVSMENDDKDNNLSLLGKNINSNNWQNGNNDSHQQQYQQQSVQSEYNDISRLQDGITSMQLIRFGLGNIFGPTARMKICNVMGHDTTPYLMDEQRMKELLLMSGATDVRATQFINWLKINARYVSHPIGFLAANIPNSGQGQDQQGGQGQNNYYMNGGSNNGNGNGSKRIYGPNAMDDYYYQTRVYTEGFPPDHPVNQEALKNHLEQKRQDDQLKSVDKQLNMAIRMQMMKSFGNMDGSGGGNNHNSLFSPEMMVMMGMARWRSNGNDENGKPIFVIEPTFGQPPMGGGIGVTNPTDSTTQMTAMVTMMKEMMQLATSMNKSDPTQQSFMQTVMQGLASKMFEPQTNKMQEVIQTAELLQKLKGPESTVPNMGGITDPNVIIRTKRMELDKEFGMRRLDLENKELDLQRERLAMQDREASQNMDKIIEGVQQFAPMLVGMFQQFFMGNRNGQPGQPGVGPQGGGMIPGQETNPANLILKMEYEKQRQRQQEEARMRSREWEEELRRKNMESEMLRARSQMTPQNPQNPESQRVIVEQPKTGYVTEDKQQPEVFTEDTFLPYSSRELEEVLNKAAREKKKLEEYINTVGKVYQDKIMGGSGKNNDDDEDDYDLEIVENEGRKMTPQNNPNTQKQKQEQQEPNFDEILDSYSKKRIDPDYDGVLDDTTEEVEIEPQDHYMDEQEGESVEI